MASLDVIPAIANALRANSTITNLLGSGSNSIILAGNLVLGKVPDTAKRPLIALQDGGIMGSTRSLPFTEQLINVRVYDDLPAANAVSYLNINAILTECINALHKASLTTEMSYQALFELQYDNYISPDLIDDLLKLPCKYARFRAFVVFPNLYD